MFSPCLSRCPSVLQCLSWFLSGDLIRPATISINQEAQLSQGDRATLRVIFRLVTHSHSRSFEMTPLSRACVSPY